MKQMYLTMMLVIFTAGFGFSQDVITKKTGEEIKVKVLEVGNSEIKFKKFENQDGPVYSIPRLEILMIRYENGTKDIFNEPAKPAEVIQPEAAVQPDVQPVEQKKEVVKKRYSNRIGIILGGGSGFKNVTIGFLNDGTKVAISFGGGSGGGLEYGYEFSRHFDLGGIIFYQSSSLSSDVANAKMTFTRAFLSVTPALIVPLTKKDKTRFKFGVGLDWFFFSNLSTDLSKISGGFKDEWKYKNAFGEHLNITFELNTNNKRFSFSGQLKFYNVNYSFDKETNGYVPVDDDLEKPTGSGVDFLLGFAYHFR